MGLGHHFSAAHDDLTPEDARSHRLDPFHRPPMEPLSFTNVDRHVGCQHPQHQGAGQRHGAAGKLQRADAHPRLHLDLREILRFDPGVHDRRYEPLCGRASQHQGGGINRQRGQRCRVIEGNW